MNYDYPKPRRLETKEVIHGIEVADPYRWMEDTESEELKEFIKQQNKVTEKVLNSSPYRDKMHDLLRDHMNYVKMGTPFHHHGKWYYYYNSGLLNQAILYTKDDIHNTDETPRVFFDPNQLSKEGHSALSTTAFSHDGKFWGYTITEKGSDWMHCKIKVVETGEDLDDRLEWIKHSTLSWSPDNKGLFYSRCPIPDTLDEKMDEAAGTETCRSESHKLFYHRLGTSQSEDNLIYYDATQPNNLYYADVTDDGRYLLICVQQSCEGKNKLWYVDLKDKDPLKITEKDIVKLIDTFEWEYDFIDNVGECFYIKTTDNAPKKRFIKIDLKRPERENWVTLIPEGDNVLQWCQTGKPDKLYVCYLEDVKDVMYHTQLSDPSVLHKFDLGVGSVLRWNSDDKISSVFFSFTSFTFPNRIFFFDAEKEMAPTLWYETKIKDFDSSNFVTEQVFYPSKDGTKIPMFLVYKKDMKRDGTNCTILYGYGGFRIVETPYFSATRLAFLKTFNGVWAMANLRGGLEYGEEWWAQGARKNKQNTFDDFQWAAKWLHENKITSPEHLVIEGGSNGGLLVAVCANQAPELFAAAVCRVGVLDIARFHKFTVGYTWTSDYGDPENKEDFEVLIKYSPYHNVNPDKEYPSVMCLCCDHDDRVVPLHTYKFIAELQHKRGHQKRPLIARIEVDAGHGSGKPTVKVIDELTDIYCFVTSQTGAKWVS